MGKLSHEPQIHHFSHPHPLHLSSPPLQSPSCSACKLPLPTTTSGGTSADFIYTCTTCNFSLHVSCTQFPQLITHPSHLNHPLSLLPTSAYPEGHFKCDACKCRGNGFSYHCSQCNFDLHVICASKPLSATNSLHPHPLELTFSPPYEKNGFFCDICRKIGTEQWFYRCVPCEFDIHLECVNSPQPAVPPLLQHQRPLPVVSQNQNRNLYGNQNGLMHSASTGGGLQNNYSPVVAVGPIDNSGGDNTGNGLANTGGLLQNNYPPASAAGLGPLYNGGNVNTKNTVMTAVAAPTPLHRHHHHHSLPSVLQNGNQISYGNQNHLMHSASTGGRLQNNYPPAASTSRVAPPPPLQHHHSLPAISQNQNQIMYGNQNHLMHSASTGGRLQNNYPPAASASRVAPPPPLQHHHSLPVVSQNQNQIMYGNQNHLMHSASTGGRIQNYYPPAAAAAEVGTRYIGGHATTGNYLANTSEIIQGAVQQIGQKFVLGATQQLGESVMQSLIGAGDGGGDTVVNVLGGVLDGDTVVSVLGGALGSLC